MILIERQAASHWYLRDGTPFHEVRRKDGSGMRAVTLGDARRCLALPSVTNVLGVVAKPALDAWKIEQGIISALTLPRLPDEPVDAFAKRVVDDMGQQTRKAADFGSAIHAACELYILRKEKPEDKTLWPFLEMWWRWFDERVERVDCVERVFVHLDFGYAGRVDMVAKIKGIGWAVVDFKTQRVKRDAAGLAKPTFYETWALQLAAYQQAIAHSHANDVEGMVSVVIDSGQPGPVYVKAWGRERGAGSTEEEVRGQKSDVRGQRSDFSDVELFRVFLSAMALWKYTKGYDPTALVGECARPEMN